jgi:MFS family permease
MSPEKKFYGWFLVAALWVIYVLNGTFPFIGGSVINAYMAKELGMERSVLGLGFTILSFSMGMPAALIALCINRRGIRFTLFLGSLILVLGALLMAFVVVQNWQYVVVFGIIIGLGIGFGSVLPVQTGVTLWFKKKRALAMSIVLSAAGIGGFVAAPLLDKIIAAAGGNWKTGSLFTGGLSVVAAVLALVFVKNSPSDLGQAPDGVTEDKEPSPTDLEQSRKTTHVYHSPEDWRVADAVKTKTFWFVFAGSVGYIAPFMTCVTHGVIHLRDVGLSPASAAMAAGLMMLFSILGRLGAGVLGDRIEPRYIWIVALFFLGAGSLVLIRAQTMFPVYAYAVLVGIGFGAAYVSMTTLIGNYFGANAFASIMGIIFPFNTFFGSSTPWLAGLIYDHYGSYGWAFAGVSGMAFVGGIFLFFANPPNLPNYRSG